MITFRQTVLVIGFTLFALFSNKFANAQQNTPTVTNLALGKPAEQSSTYEESSWPDGSFLAAMGVDGIIEVQNFVHNKFDNFQCTNSGGPQWWKVNLGPGKTFVITKIIIYNRDNTLDQAEIRDRLNGAVVKIFETGNTEPKWTSAQIVGNDNDGVIIFDNMPENAKGNEVKVELNTGEHLHMAEVQVFGYEETSTSGNASGDPHFKTFQNIFFSYHGACDILLLASTINKVMIQIRTTRVDTHHQSSYSYISQAAVKIQDVILEVSADGILLINGEDSSDRVPATIAGYAGLTKTIKGKKRNIISYKVDLGNGRSIDLRSNTKTEMMYIDVDGNFSDSKGLLGPPTGEDGLYSRDGTIMDVSAEGSYNSYSQSWQVLSDEPMLFQEARFPQHPLGCSYTTASNEEDGGVPVSPNLRRRLTDVVEVSKDEVMKACADAIPGERKDFCVMDVMLTGDLDAAEDEFYYLN